MIKDNELKELYRQAYKKWGIQAQLFMVIEEMSELTKSICKSDRHGILKEQESLMEEYVDVCIMLEQMEVILSDHLHGYEPMYKNIRESKLEYLKKMVYSQ